MRLSRREMRGAQEHEAPPGHQSRPKVSAARRRALRGMRQQPTLERVVKHASYCLSFVAPLR